MDPLESAMRLAAAAARRWLGATSPNPAVGAVALDAEGRVLATAAHRRAGEAHAEALLLDDCRRQGCLTQLAVLCVTLEPCNHRGLTPPCTEAIIAAGIRKVAIGARDPNPKVTGGGIERLRQAGIEVIEDVAGEECRQLIHAFAYAVTAGKPWLTVKRALTSAGSMLPPARQKTFTSAASLTLAHRLRKKADAILTGSGTILADDPLFTVRHAADYPDKRRVLAILDRRGRVQADYIAKAETRGFEVMVGSDIGAILDELARKGVRDVLAEAGPALSQSLLDSGLWTMSVAIRQGVTDSIDAVFNMRHPLPFDPRQFCWDYILPRE